MELIRYWVFFRLMRLCDWIHPEKYHCWACSYECICWMQQYDQERMEDE